MPEKSGKAFLLVAFDVGYKLGQLKGRIEGSMATAQQFKDLLAKIDADTNRVADVIRKLVAQLGGGGLTEAEEADILTELGRQADLLGTVGTDVPA